MLYPRHPWSGCLVRVRDVAEKAGTSRARYVVDDLPLLHFAPPPTTAINRSAARRPRLSSTINIS